MKDFNLPIPKQSLPDPEPLSMDDYAALVLSNLQAMGRAKDSFKSRQKEFVNVPFRIHRDV